jgi:hypothetical protein
MRYLMMRSISKAQLYNCTLSIRPFFPKFINRNNYIFYVSAVFKHPAFTRHFDTLDKTNKPYIQILYKYTKLAKYLIKIDN